MASVGIARFRDTETLVHYLKALAMPTMRGKRVAVLSRSGGHAVIAADAIETSGLELAELPDDFLKEAQTHLRANVINLTNPMDLGDLFDLDVYGQLAEGTLSMDGVDGFFFKKRQAVIGALGDLGVHKIDLIRWFLEDEVVQTTAMCATLEKQNCTVDDTAYGTVAVQADVSPDSKPSLNNGASTSNCMIPDPENTPPPWMPP